VTARRAPPEFRRGDVCLVDFGPPVGERPAVVVSTDDLNAVSQDITVAAITKRLPSSERERPQQVRVTTRATSLVYDGMVKADRLLSIEKTNVRRLQAVRLSPELMARVDRALWYALGLDDMEDEQA